MIHREDYWTVSWYLVTTNNFNVTKENTTHVGCQCACGERGVGYVSKIIAETYINDWTYEYEMKPQAKHPIDSHA